MASIAFVVNAWINIIFKKQCKCYTIAYVYYGLSIILQVSILYDYFPLHFVDYQKCLTKDCPDFKDTESKYG